MKRKQLLLVFRNAVSKTKSFLQRMLSDARSGDVSSKRVISFAGFLSLLITMFVNALYPKSIAPAPHLVDAIQYIVIAAMLGTVADKFSNQKQKKDDEPTI